MSMTRAQFADAMSPSFEEIFNTALLNHPYSNEFENYFNMENMAYEYIKTSYVSGFGQIPEKNEGATITYDEILEGLDKTFTAKTYALAYRISEEMIEDERYGLIKQLPEALGRSFRDTLNTDGANVLNRGFNSSYTGADGIELFATNHVLLDGSTQKNELTTAADLSYTSLQQALNDIAATTDDRGLKLQLMPKKLIVHSDKLWDAQQLLQTQSGYQSGNGDINPAAGSLELVAGHYLTDSDAWFIQCEGHRVTWFWRVKPSHGEGNDFDTGDLKYKTRGRWTYGWDVPWGYFGSPGA